MGEKTAIPMFGATWNWLIGCTRIPDDPACENCYMHREQERYGKDPSDVHVASPATVNAPRHPSRYKPRSRVFTCSWSDFFHEKGDGARPTAWSIIKDRPDVLFHVLTKRTDRIEANLPPWWHTRENPGNVAIGFTAANQEWYERRAAEVLAIRGIDRAAFIFASLEPLLGEIDLESVPVMRFETPGVLNPLTGEWWPALGDADLEAAAKQTGPKLGWVWAGGETGGEKARPTNPAWLRKLRAQLVAAEVPFFFKAWGEWKPCPIPLPSRFQNHPELLDGVRWGLMRYGPKNHLLDGQAHQEVPLWVPVKERGAIRSAILDAWDYGTAVMDFPMEGTLHALRDTNGRWTRWTPKDGEAVDLPDNEIEGYLWKQVMRAS